MRDLHELDAWRDISRRVVDLYGNTGDGTAGVFRLPRGGRELVCVASSGGGWDHVSVSLINRCPSWNEMEFIKRHFFKDDETAMQLHVPVTQHINCHPFTLHIWRPQQAEIPLPPAGFV